MKMMQFIHFFDQTQDRSFLENASIVAFLCAEDTFPILFTAQLISFFKTKQLPIEVFGVDALDLPHIFSRLETSFLGMKVSYWLRGIDALDKKARQQVLAYLANYQGPHQVMLVVPKDDAHYFAKKVCVELPNNISIDSVRPLLMLFNKNNPTLAKHMSSIVAKYDGLSLDQFCMLVNYMQVVGRVDDYTQIVDRVIESEHSLFTLAQYFFAKNSSEFYALWALVKDQYPVTFWTTYWSEQLWRAYFTRYYLSKGQLTQAKFTAARLPFSFMQKDWKKASLEQLKDAHQALYQLDHVYKNNGETEAGLDLIFNHFFS